MIDRIFKGLFYPHIFTFFGSGNKRSEAVLVLFVVKEVGAAHQGYIVAIKAHVERALIRRDTALQLNTIQLNDVALQNSHEVALLIA